MEAKLKGNITTYFREAAGQRFKGSEQEAEEGCIHCTEAILARRIESQAQIRLEVTGQRSPRKSEAIKRGQTKRDRGLIRY